LNANATDVIADAVRRALEELDTFPVEAELRAAVLILEVSVPDPKYPDDPGEAFTHMVWKCGPDSIGTTHAYGIAAVTAYAMLLGGETG
jgi:hypothetical protein